jgi:fatty acid hydroxylase family protein
MGTALGASPATLREALPVFLRHGSPRVLLAALAAALALRVALGGWSAWDLVPPLLIAALWPLQEWAIHVAILHFRPRRVGRWTLDFQVPREHRAHHAAPYEIPLVFIPLRSFLYTLPLLAALCWLAAPSLPLAATSLASYLLLALHYEWIHFLIHTRVWPRSALYQRLWRNHRLHHFKNERFWYGVTRLRGDRLLGTDGDPREVPTSATARSLLGERAA